MRKAWQTKKGKCWVLGGGTRGSLVGPAGGDAGEKAKIQSATEGLVNAIN